MIKRQKASVLPWEKQLNSWQTFSQYKQNSKKSPCHIESPVIWMVSTRSQHTLTKKIPKHNSSLRHTWMFSVVLIILLSSPTVAFQTASVFLIPRGSTFTTHLMYFTCLWRSPLTQLRCFLLLYFIELYFNACIAPVKLFKLPLAWIVLLKIN